MSAYGNTHARRILTQDDARLIREAVEYRRTEVARLRELRDRAHAEMVALQRNLSTASLARKFEVSESALEKVVSGDSWVSA